MTLQKFLYIDTCGRLNADPSKYVHVLIPRACKELLYLARKDLVNVIRFKDMEMGRVSWTVQVGPIKPHKALKLEEEGRKDQSNVTVEEEEI